MLSYDGVNWDRFNELVDLTMTYADDWPLHSEAHVDYAIGELTRAVKLAIDKFLVRPVPSGNQYRNLPVNVRFLQKVKFRTLRSKTRETSRFRPRVEILDLLKFRIDLLTRKLTMT